MSLETGVVVVVDLFDKDTSSDNLGEPEEVVEVVEALDEVVEAVLLIRERL
jgi:hypothetical protein